MIDPKHILRVQAYIENVNSRHLNPTEDLLESFAYLIVNQQEQIDKLEKFMSVLRQRELDRTTEKICNNIWS